MIKTVAYLAMFTVAGLIVAGLVAMRVLFFFENLTNKHDDVINWSPFSMPTFILIDSFVTTPAALFCVALGTAVTMIAIGFYLRRLRVLELGEQQSEHRDLHE